MNTTVNIDKAGRVIIPKAVRVELGLEAGDTLELDFEGEHVSLRPVRASTPLRKERGVWVFQPGGQLSAAEAGRMIEEARESRVGGTRGKR